MAYWFKKVPNRGVGCYRLKVEKMRITKSMLFDVCLGVAALLALCLVIAWGSQGPTRESIREHQGKMVAPLPLAPQEPIDDPASIKNKIQPAEKTSDSRAGGIVGRKIKRKKIFRGRFLRRMF